jgi:hypothetical protein
MRLYLAAIVVTLAATAVIINACLLKASPARAAPAQVVQLM